MNAANNNSIPRQTWLSLLILLILVSIAGGIFARQFRFNPAVILSTGTSASSITPQRTAPPPAADSLLELPPGIQPLTPPESFSPDRMSDKINGKAELYLSAGCKGLQSQRFTESVGSPSEERWMEVFVFDMGSHENAFAVYSSQRRDDAVPIGLTAHGYQTENALYFIHGGYYVELVASDASAAARRAIEAMAANFVKATAVESVQIAEPELFPAVGLDANSIVMIADDAFGFDRLDRVYTAAYRLEGVELTAFLSSRPSDRAAAEMAAAYRDFLLRFGGVDVTAQSGMDIPGVAVIEILGTSEVIFTRGPYLAGIHEATDISAAAEIARQLYERLDDGSIAK